MGLAVSLRPPPEEALVRSQVSPYEICGGQSVTVTGVCPSTSASPCQCHSTIAPHASSTTCYIYQKDEHLRSGNLAESSVFADICSIL